MKKIILIGGGGHFNAVLDVIEASKKFKIIGFVDKKKIINRKHGIAYLGNDDTLISLKKKTSNVHISFGQITNLNLRADYFKKLKKLKFQFPKIISLNSYVSKKSIIGDGTIIMHGVLIGPNVKIGSNCIINTGSIIEHDVKIDDHCHISTGSILNGGAEIGSQSFIGSGSVIKQEVKIGKKCFVNANLFIERNLKNNSIRK